MTRDASRDDVIEDLQRVAEIVGRGPSKDEYSEHGEYSYHFIQKYFDGLRDARTAAELSNSDTARNTSVTRDELIEAIHDLHDELGRVPKREEMKDQGRYSEDPYRRVFGTWSEAVVEAGYQPHRRGKEIVDRVEMTCAQCGATDMVRQSQVNNQENWYCDRSCKHEWQAEHIVGENHHQYNRETVECAWCGVEYDEKPSEVKELNFCSPEHMGQYRSEHRSGKDSPLWTGGREQGRGPNWPKQRVKAICRDQARCQRCGMTEPQSLDEYDQVLEVHHKTPFKTFDDYEPANRLENLITLCIACHRTVEATDGNLSD